MPDPVPSATAAAVTRRHLLTGAAAGGLVVIAGAPGGDANATPAAMREAIKEVIGNATLRQGRVKIELPPLVENGNAVPLSISVDSPMTDANHVKAIHVFTEKNPQPNVASFHLGPRAGSANIATRMRLADTQIVTAIAEMSDGSYWRDDIEVVVTLAACLEEG